MKTTATICKQKTFSNLMRTQIQDAKTQDFYNWMIKIKSNFLADNEKMNNAFLRLNNFNN